MSNIDTVLFDFDGTVMNTNDVIMMSWQHTFRTLEGREEDPEVLLRTFGEPLETTMKNFFPMFRQTKLSKSTEVFIGITLESS